MSDRVQPQQRGDEPIQGRRRRVYPYYFSPLFPISIAGTADKGGGSVKTETIHGRRIRPYPTHFSPVLVPAETVPFDPATDGFPYQQGPPPAPAARLVQANFGTFVAEQDVFFDPKDLPTFYQAPHVVFQRSKRQHEYPALFFDPRPLTIPLLSWQAVYPNQVYGKRPLPIRAGERHRILIESFFTGDDASWHPTYPDFARVGEAVPLYWVAPVYETVDIAPEPEAKKRVGGLLTLGAGS